MKAENFCKIFILSLLSFISFLISTVFLTSLNNIKSQSLFFYIYNTYGFKKDDYKVYSSYYNGIASLFSFILISFLLFAGGLVYLIKVDKMDSENNAIEIRVIGNNNRNNQIQSSERISPYNNSLDDVSNSNDINTQPDSFEQYKVPKYILIYSFIVNHFLYLIELIVICVLHQKSRNIVNYYKERITLRSTESFDDLEFLTNIILILIIVGYAFFFIFIIFYFYLLVLFGIFSGGRRQNIDGLTSIYCKCISDCIENNCNKCADCLSPNSSTQSTNDENNTIEEKTRIIYTLTEYKDKLKELNTDLAHGAVINENELIDLNLYEI